MVAKAVGTDAGDMAHALVATSILQLMTLRQFQNQVPVE